jgi:quercetin dioxygenase-like cupin family protein
MITFKLKLACIAVLLGISASVGLVFAHTRHENEPPVAASQSETVAVVLSQTLPKLDYRKASMITVEYAPGMQSARHRHDVAVFVYVLEGTVESQIEGQEAKIYKRGGVWYEPPGAVHAISRNVSKTDPAKILVFFVGEEGKSPTTFLK